jgi:hypothetical protein
LARARLWANPCGPARLFGGLADVVHAADALGGGETELLNQERQIDAEALGGGDSATGRRVAQAFFGSSQFGRRENVVLPHQS